MRIRQRFWFFKRDEERTECNISVNGKILEQVNEVVYLGNMFSRVERYEMDVERRIAAGNKVNGALAALMRRRNVSTAARLAVHSFGTDCVIRQRNVRITEEE